MRTISCYLTLWILLRAISFVKKKKKIYNDKMWEGCLYKLFITCKSCKLRYDSFDPKKGNYFCK